MKRVSDRSPIAPDDGQRRLALAILFVMPLFFSSNIVLGRAAITLGAEPFTLAFLRWSLTALCLLPFVWPALSRHRQEIATMVWPLLGMGFLGMWICGALVYVALKYTSATNGTLIYTTSPVMIILIEYAFRGRRIGLREAAGIVIAFLGVAVIVFRGEWARLAALSFNLGDLLILAAAFSWALYSFFLRAPRFATLPTLPLFALIAIAGSVVLLPFAVAESIWLDTFPSGTATWAYIGGIVLFASLLAFSTFQFGVKTVGSSLAGIFLYLLPVYGVTLAVLLLGEQIHPFHLWGIALALGGVALATWPKRL